MEQIHNSHVSYGVEAEENVLALRDWEVDTPINSGNMAMQKIPWSVLKSTVSLAIAKFNRSSG